MNSDSAIVSEDGRCCKLICERAFLDGSSEDRNKVMVVAALCSKGDNELDDIVSSCRQWLIGQQMQQTVLEK